MSPTKGSLSPTTKGGSIVEPLPDLGSLEDKALKSLIEELEQQEREVSYQRRLLHGKIDILRAELVARLHRDPDRQGLAQDMSVGSTERDR